MTIRLDSIAAPEDVAALKPLLALAKEDSFRALLEESLHRANDLARDGDPQTQIEPLDRVLYDALPWADTPWPTTVEDYIKFLVEFACWIPQQSTDPAWLDPGSPLGEHQEVYDRLCMCQVSGVNMTHEVNKMCDKGDEFGYFTFGGSDIIVLFQAGTNPVYNPAFGNNPPYSLYGTEIATVTPR